MARKKVIICVLLVLVITMSIGCCDIKNTAISVNRVESSEQEAPFEVRMLDVGQGLCILIKSDGKYMVYDGGGRDTSSYVVSYLKKNEIDHLDYMFVSHYDEDHISGLVGILHTTEVDRIISPDYESESQIYSSFRNAIDMDSSMEEHPSVGDTYELGDAFIEVLGPENYEAVGENDRSIAIRVEYGGFSCILTGDSEYEAEAYIANSEENIESDMYVVGHHGSASSSSDIFLDAVSPDYAFISVGADNSYGHPDATTISKFEERGIEIYRSDEIGEVTAYTDGNVLWINNNGKKVIEENQPTDITDARYVINTNTWKFHYPSCRCVGDMEEHNKLYSDEDRDTIIGEGYEPCGVCRP